MIETKKIIQAISYLLNTFSKPIDKIAVVKYIYLSDKYHLMKYGRTITEDMYVAMERGPVGSTVLNVLDLDAFNLSEDELSYAQKYLKKHANTIISKNGSAARYDMLSETDKKVIKLIHEKFGSMDKWSLVDYTHKFPEWKKHEYLFKHGKSRREIINIEEMLSTDKIFDCSEEHLDEVREIIKQRKCYYWAESN
ncbi:MAG: Panacea domain-containing protein [Elusimicrobiota bacterium]